MAKGGLNNLTGASGEYLVMGELLRKGVIAGLTTKNSPAFDILATKDSKTVKIRVKTKGAEYSYFQWSAKKDKTIFPWLAPNDNSDFVIMVSLGETFNTTDFYIARTHDVERFLIADYTEWVSTPGPRKPQRDPENKKRHLDTGKFPEFFAAAKGNWDLLWS